MFDKVMSKPHNIGMIINTTLTDRLVAEQSLNNE